MAMTTTGRYEAGGNAMWLAVCPQDKMQRILGGSSASWQDIDEIEEQFFTATLRSATHDGGDDRTWERLVFPDVLPAGVRDKAALYASEHWQMVGTVICRRGILL